ncbi:MAG TPA: DUF6134 family protein [Phnomibacter sp.]|nr:DUF6134 family protein [Phnomibacter sp.]
MKKLLLPPSPRSIIAAISVVSWIWLFAVVPTGAQCTYQVMRKGKPIGKVQTYTMQTNAGRLYGLTMDVRASVIIPMHVQIQLMNLCNEKEDLTEARFSKTINNTSPTQHSIRTNASGYDLVANNKQSKLDGIISFSSLLLYFKEPVQQQQIFSETHLQWLPLQKMGEGVYQIKTPDGYYTTYWFQKGVLEKVEGENMFGKVQFVKL